VWKGQLRKKGFKKKLYACDPEKEKITVQITKRKGRDLQITPQDNERCFREKLAQKISGTLIGIWLLVGEHLRLGTWDLLKGWSESADKSLEPRIALQMVHESAICVNRVRRKNALANQGFESVSGLSYLVRDEDVHEILNRHTVSEARQMQIALLQLRNLQGHYQGDILAIDPHRIVTYSKRIMPKKKKHPEDPSKKMLQTFFCVDGHTGQPLGFTIGSPGQTATRATIELMEMVQAINRKDCLFVADKEHFTLELLTYAREKNYKLLVPAILMDQIKSKIKHLDYQRKWAGFALADTTYAFEKQTEPFRLIAQRTGECCDDYQYKAFMTTARNSSTKLLTEDYPGRWSVEEFFNFESAMGIDRAATMNLNIRYGRLSLSLIAQAIVHQFRKKLPAPYNQWNAEHTAKSIFSGLDGDIRVKDDTILVTLYNVPENLGLRKHYENLPEILKTEGVNPKVPWLYDYKVDFRFK